MKTILEMKGIVKSFAGTEVLHSVGFELKEEEVHALIGENGAGKSTLMKILMGEHKADAGLILLDGREVIIPSPAKALNLGISMIHQELYPIPDMTISENIFLGREPSKLGIVNEKELEKITAEQLQSLNVDFNPKAKMRELSVAETQIIEIVKAISYNSRIIIMDEPTSALTGSEIDNLFEMIKLLKSEKVAIIYITHKIDELVKIVDSVTVLRDGFVAGNGKIEEMSTQRLVSMMVGRDITDMYPKTKNVIGKTILSVRGLTKQGEFENVNFDLHTGEILGIAGLLGAGRTEIVTSIFGDSKLDQGEIVIKGKKVSLGHPKDAVRYKIAFVPEDRKLLGLNLVGSLSDNIILATHKRVSSAGIIKKRKCRKYVDSMIAALSIKAVSRDQGVAYLSGGNQQKVVLAKWLLNEPDILILDEPTRGIDVGAKAEIYRLINDLARAGKAIILISSELPEIIGMCDRVLVLHAGRIRGELTREELSQEKIMTLASSYNAGVNG
jgi:ABC-type sugar transport system ATPase subunit